MINTPSRQSASELTWVKSSYSTSEGGDCVEVAAAPSAVQVRDSKVTAGPRLALGRGAWASFIDRLRD
ncbi:DUF397 domain-containing protein [Streptomyces mayteni]